MFRNYLITALRNIRRYKGFAFINMAGLAVGMACFLLIVFYVRFETSYDGFHKNGRDIYLVVRENTADNYSESKGITGAPLAPLLLRNFPSVEDAVRFTAFRGEFVGRGEKRFLETRFFYADDSVFKVFTFPLAEGDPATALRDPFAVVLTAETARRYFGGQNPLGQVLSYNFYGRSFDFRVTGVLKPIPRNSQFEFDFLASYSSLKLLLGENAEYFLTRHWDSPTWTFVKLRAGADPAELNRQLPAFSQKFVDKWSYASVNHRLQPLRDLYFHSPGPALGAHGSSELVVVLSAIAAFILLIACINFMNLATARSESRAREIGIRKVVGSEKRQLVAQFLGESLVYSFLALVLASGVVELLRPAFSNFVGKNIPIHYLRDPGLLAIMVLTAAGVGLFSGAYPAFFLASLRPFFILKGQAGGRGSGLAVRKILVVGQFVLSIALISAALLMGRQTRFLSKADMGFKKENVLAIPVRDGSLVRQYESLKARWLQRPGVLGVTASSMEPGVGGPNGINLRGRGNPDTEMPIVYVDHDFFKVLDVRMAGGRDFSRAVSTDAAGALVLNESARQRLAWTDGIGEAAELFFKEGGKIVPVYQTTVIGVVKDFHFRDLTTSIQPVLFKIDARRFSSLLVRLDGQRIPEAIDGLKSSWQEFHFNQPFEFTFLEDDMKTVYKSFSNFTRLTAYATGLAIFIACLGLFGLASYTIEKRVKEIGVRKVLGASVSRIALLLSKDFLKLVLVANVVAWPAAFYFIENWLRSFAYRISVGFGTFVLAGLLALAVALVTVGARAVKAALANPADSIRYE